MCVCVCECECVCVCVCTVREEGIQQGGGKEEDQK